MGNNDEIYDYGNFIKLMVNCYTIVIILITLSIPFSLFKYIDRNFYDTYILTSIIIISILTFYPMFYIFSIWWLILPKQIYHSIKKFNHFVLNSEIIINFLVYKFPYKPKSDYSKNMLSLFILTFVLVISALFRYIYDLLK